MRVLPIKTKKNCNIFISDNYLHITEISKNSCSLILNYQKKPESPNMIQDIQTNKNILENIEPMDAYITLDSGMGIVKMRSLPKSIKRKDVEKALRMSIEMEIGHDANKYYLAFDVLTQDAENNNYIFSYAEKNDVDLLEDFFRKHKLNPKSITHFIVDFINAIISLGQSLPMNIIYISKHYYVMLKLGDSLVDYRKKDIVDFDNEKDAILDEILNYVVILGLENIGLVYSELFEEYPGVYSKLKTFVRIDTEIFPPYDFDCYMKKINGGIY